MDLKTRHDFADELQHQSVDDQNKKTKGHQDKRNTEKEQNRPDERVDDPKQESRAQQAANSGITEPYDIRCHEDGEGGDEPAKYEVSHDAYYELLAEFAQINAPPVASPHEHAKS